MEITFLVMHIQSKFYYFFVKIKSIESLCTKVVIVAVKLYYAFQKKKKKENVAKFLL